MQVSEKHPKTAVAPLNLASIENGLLESDKGNQTQILGLLLISAKERNLFGHLLKPMPQTGVSDRGRWHVAACPLHLSRNSQPNSPTVTENLHMPALQNE
jgi:hypothetical protein